MQADWDKFRSRLVTGDETQIHHYDTRQKNSRSNGIGSAAKSFTAKEVQSSAQRQHDHVQNLYATLRVVWFEKRL